MRRFITAVTAAALLCGAAWAQSADEGAAFEQSMAAAQAASARPGDEQMTCDQLQAEMMTVMNDPAMQANIAQMGASAQAQMDRAQSARSQGMGMGMAGMGMGFLSAFVPGLGFAQQAMMMNQARQAQQQANQATAERQVMMANTQEIMPQMMRGQRLYELAQAQSCAFLQQQGAPQQ